MTKTIRAKLENGVLRPLDPDALSALPEGAIVTVTITPEPDRSDPGWMKRLLDDEDAEHYVRGRAARPQDH